MHKLDEIQIQLLFFSVVLPVLPLLPGSWDAGRGSDPAIRGNEHFMFKLSWYGAEGAEIF